MKLSEQESVLYVPFRAGANLFGDHVHQTVFDGPLFIPDNPNQAEIFSTRSPSPSRPMT